MVMPLWISHLFSRSRSFTRSPLCLLQMRAWNNHSLLVTRYYNRFNIPWIFLVFSGKCGETQSKMSSWKIHSVACCLSRYISYNLEPVYICHISIWNGVMLNVTVIANVIIMVIIIIFIIIFIVSSVASSFYWCAWAALCACWYDKYA
jgi:hypothetical protein